MRCRGSCGIIRDDTTSWTLNDLLRVLIAVGSATLKKTLRATIKIMFDSRTTLVLSSCFASAGISHLLFAEMSLLDYFAAMLLIVAGALGVTVVLLQDRMSTTSNRLTYAIACFVKSLGVLGALLMLVGLAT